MQSFQRFWASQPKLRKRLMILAMLVASFFIIVRIVYQFLPSGYRTLECINTNDIMGRQERLLQVWSEVAKEHDFTWWADYGMLLGAVRNGHLLPWDKDMDGAYWVQDHDKLMALRKPLQDRGFELHGITICYKEDYEQMSIDSEIVVSRLELFPYILHKGMVLRNDHKDAALDTSIMGWLWWQVLVLSMTTNIEYYEDMFPLGKVTLNHFKTSSEDTSTWSLEMPAPKDAKKYLRRMYGRSWTKEVPWKLTCYM